jgi:hypothetical protein
MIDRYRRRTSAAFLLLAIAAGCQPAVFDRAIAEQNVAGAVALVAAAFWHIEAVDMHHVAVAGASVAWLDANGAEIASFVANAEGRWSGRRPNGATYIRASAPGVGRSVAFEVDSYPSQDVRLALGRPVLRTGLLLTHAGAPHAHGELRAGAMVGCVQAVSPRSFRADAAGRFTLEVLAGTGLELDGAVKLEGAELGAGIPPCASWRGCIGLGASAEPMLVAPFGTFFVRGRAFDASRQPVAAKPQLHEGGPIRPGLRDLTTTPTISRWQQQMGIVLQPGEFAMPLPSQRAATIRLEADGFEPQRIDVPALDAAHRCHVVDLRMTPLPRPSSDATTGAPNPPSVDDPSAPTNVLSGDFFDQTALVLGYTTATESARPLTLHVLHTDGRRVENPNFAVDLEVSPPVRNGDAWQWHAPPPEHTVTLRVRDPAGTASGSLTVHADTVGPLHLILQPIAKLEVHVRCNGAAAQGLTVVLARPAGGKRAVGATGTVDLTADAGPTTVEIRLGDERLATRELHLLPGSRSETAFDLSL